MRSHLSQVDERAATRLGGRQADELLDVGAVNEGDVDGACW
jgi:hypothetical protein